MIWWWMSRQWVNDDIYKWAMMIFTMWWWWCVQWNDGNAYNETLPMRWLWYLQWGTDGGYHGAQMVFTMRYSWWDDNGNIYSEILMIVTYKMRNNDLCTIINFFKKKKADPFPNLSLNFTDGFSCGTLRHLGWKRSYHKEGTPTSPSGVPFLHGCRQLPVRLMGPLCSL